MAENDSYTPENDTTLSQDLEQQDIYTPENSTTLSASLLSVPQIGAVTATAEGLGGQSTLNTGLLKVTAADAEALGETISVSGTANFVTDNKLIDNFEDGTTQGWNIIDGSGNFTAQQDTVLEGSYSARLEQTGDIVTVEKELTNKHEKLSYKVQPTEDHTTLETDIVYDFKQFIFNSAGEKLLRIEFAGSEPNSESVIKAGATELRSFTAGETYKIELIKQGPSSVQVLIDGVDQGTYTATNNRYFDYIGKIQVEILQFENITIGPL